MTEDSFFVLKYNQEAVSRAMENKDELVTEDGIEDAFEVIFLVFSVCVSVVYYYSHVNYLCLYACYLQKTLIVR